jgi:glycosyltransferase involved in cell wall biosynthesis
MTTVLPLVTVGIIVLNREWIIGEMLESLFRQNYPLDRVFLAIVDGGSTDRTLEIVRTKVSETNLAGHEIVVTQPSIPEQRNRCIDMMRGEVLVFWDSDIVLSANALEALVNPLIRGEADVAMVQGRTVFMQSIGDLQEVIRKLQDDTAPRPQEAIREVPTSGMGWTAISKRVLAKGIRFDPELTWAEDWDFGLRAREAGSKIVEVRDARGLNINLGTKSYSDIYSDLPLAAYMRALRKKARTRALGATFRVSSTYLASYYRHHPRFIYYLGYPWALMATLYGLSSSNVYLASLFPAYLLFYLAVQVRRRGVKRGVRMTFRSFVAGIPYAYLQCYYFLKHLTRKPE